VNDGETPWDVFSVGTFDYQSVTLRHKDSVFTSNYHVVDSVHILLKSDDVELSTFAGDLMADNKVLGGSGAGSCVE
jgi:fructosamine-3-kinase